MTAIPMALTAAERRVHAELSRRFEDLVAAAPWAQSVLRHYRVDHLMTTPATERRIGDLAVAVHRLEAVLEDERAPLPADLVIVSAAEAEMHPGFDAFETEIVDEEAELLRVRATCRGGMP